MSKKIDEKELNNVSGGCGDKTEKWDYNLTCFDHDYYQVGPSVTYYPNSASESDVKNEITKKCNEIFKSNKNIYSIVYVTYQNQHGHSKGTKYRK